MHIVQDYFITRNVHEHAHVACRKYWYCTVGRCGRVTTEGYKSICLIVDELGYSIMDQMGTNPLTSDHAGRQEWHIGVKQLVVRAPQTPDNL